MQTTTSEVHVQRFTVEYRYRVVFTRRAFEPGNPALTETLGNGDGEGPRRVAVFLDCGVAEAWPELEDDIKRYAHCNAAVMDLAGEVVLIPGGEKAKTEQGVVESIVKALAERKIDRHSYAIAIGGGAVLDAVGYAAAIFHRGVRHIRFPTTVLAQDDSGVGVKNAINAHGLKNLIGTFAPPAAVINDGSFLDRLPAREKRAGMSEAVKVALIRDAEFFGWLERNSDLLAAFDLDAVEGLVRRSAELHMHQIAAGGDPFERGSARPLDFGHWSAHRLEGMTGYALSHGEAVSIGIALDARYSVLLGLLDPGEEIRVCRLLLQLGLPIWHEALEMRTPDGRLAVLQGLEDFREHLGGDLTVTLLHEIGSGVEVHEIKEDLVDEAVDWLKGIVSMQ